MSSDHHMSDSSDQNLSSTQLSDTETIHYWTIDQINGSWAKLSSLEDEQVELELPSAHLPKGAIEGQILSLCLKIDIAKSASENEAVQSLISSLTEEDDGGDFSL